MFLFSLIVQQNLSAVQSISTIVEFKDIWNIGFIGDDGYCGQFWEDVKFLKTKLSKFMVISDGKAAGKATISKSQIGGMPKHSATFVGRSRLSRTINFHTDTLTVSAPCSRSNDVISIHASMAENHCRCDIIICITNIGTSRKIELHSVQQLKPNWDPFSHMNFCSFTVWQWSKAVKINMYHTPPNFTYHWTFLSAWINTHSNSF